MTPVGRVFKFGDMIDTDVLAPGVHMKKPIDALARHCLEAVDPAFARDVRANDVVVAGKGFGVGSSREQAAQALKHLGVQAVLAKSFGGIFYRNAVNLGLVALVCADADLIGAGDRVSIDARAGRIHDHTLNRIFEAPPLPDFLVRMIEDGGLVPHLEKSFAAKRAARDGLASAPFDVAD